MRPIRARCSKASPRLGPTTLACMHGAAWRGDGAALLRALAEILAKEDRGRASADRPCCGLAGKSV